MSKVWVKLGGDNGGGCVKLTVLDSKVWVKLGGDNGGGCVKLTVLDSRSSMYLIQTVLTTLTFSLHLRPVSQ